ncbi:HEAT repeat domain-containing protein [Streptomyces bacillaris]|uniref:HEAT repeat domain-containing protein n=1 Tax=Streptomyces cavourensis TaxID=67258 RepID=A0AAD0QB48_9ACTN|nr:MULTISPECIES: HEAT repeat domain-containing protein [Streptomyces]AXI75554.1 HEAT repeat domain-containing protein [Streptomyces cavourensis]NUV42498.1 HEAT repeat domain-containing protein [Streptomyces sp. CAI-24]
MTRSSLRTEEVVSMTVTGQDTNTRRDTDTGTDADVGTDAARAIGGLADERASVRLHAALAIGSAPDPRYVGPLVERCATEPEFFVRDMLTWALNRHPVTLTLPALLHELRSERPQARSQALHTLSKIGDPQAWPAITRALLTDPDDEVARSAWRAAVVLVPEGEEPALATVLATQLGRGGHETRLSLSRALVALGEPMVAALLPARTAADPAVRAHALATEKLLRDPDTGFAFAIEEAKRVVALGGSGQEGH